MKNYFKISEFGGVWPRQSLLDLLNRVRRNMGAPVIVTSGARTPEDHVRIYCEKLDTANMTADAFVSLVPWGSKHLPVYGESTLRAVDIKARNADGLWVTGLGIQGQVTKAVAELRSEGVWGKGVHYAIGVGGLYVHLDVDRDRDITWKYT